MTESSDGVGVKPEVPVPAVPEESEGLQSLREQLRKYERPWHVGFRALVFVVSLAAFAWVMRDSGPLTMVIIIGVLLFHELGHFVAMKALGYENMQMFFVPFLGAAVSGRAQKPGGWRAGVVSLAGPLPGLVLGVCLSPFVAPGTPLALLVLVLVYVNGLNLLPFVPLDGGRLLNTIIFSRFGWLEMLGAIVGVIGIIAVPGLLPGTSGIWAGLFGGMLFHRAKMITAVGGLRKLDTDWSGPTSTLPGDALGALSGAAAEVLKSTLTTDRGRASTIAALHESAATKPASWLASLGLFAAWTLALGAGWMTWQNTQHPTARWEMVRGPEERWTVTFPARVQRTTTPKPGQGLTALHQDTTRFGGAEFSVLTLLFEDETLALEHDERSDGIMRNMVTETAKGGSWTVLSEDSLERIGRPGLQVTYREPSGVLVQSLYLASGNAIHVLMTEGASPEANVTFKDSFVLLR